MKVKTLLALVFVALVTIVLYAGVSAPNTLEPFIVVGQSSVTPPAPIPPVGMAPIRINAGGPAFTDSAGLVWAADKNFAGGTAFSAVKAIAGTVDDALFHTERYGTFAYSIPVPNGQYNVTLRFAEIFWTQSAKRVFNVLIENQSVLGNLDLYATAGANTAMDRSFRVTVNDGILNINFATVVNNAKISAIQVIALAGINQPPVVNAGIDRTITNPIDSIALTATVADDGLPVSSTLVYGWTVTTEAGTAVTFSDANELSTVATFARPGIYTLVFTANDSAAFVSDNVVVTVNGLPEFTLRNVPVDQPLEVRYREATQALIDLAARRDPTIDAILEKHNAELKSGGVRVYPRQ